MSPPSTNSRVDDPPVTASDRFVDVPATVARVVVVIALVVVGAAVLLVVATVVDVVDVVEVVLVGASVVVVEVVLVGASVVDVVLDVEVVLVVVVAGSPQQSVTDTAVTSSLVVRSPRSGRWRARTATTGLTTKAPFNSPVQVADPTPSARSSVTPRPAGDAVRAVEELEVPAFRCLRGCRSSTVALVGGHGLGHEHDHAGRDRDVDRQRVPGVGLVERRAVEGDVGACVGACGAGRQGQGRRDRGAEQEGAEKPMGCLSLHDAQ